ncbi:hypothetical protein Pla175_32780 [Pirellulimonas nuda]|uniref:Uncharacterized protein n=1 Tax=Pirellulimonas nuda TaxID=2528009 RepID=A0A518DEM1_9BACT|nr:hypothetical protein [Pirellulimonas nuda]QDU89882.1 hypothetical protein Pla175_32780 [Pirellulimonas nuda]
MPKLMLPMAALALVLLMAPTASAITISKNNPHRTANISGINYGSVQWELRQRRSSNGYSRGYAAPARRSSWGFRRGW